MWLRSIWYILTLRCEEADRLRAVNDPASLKRHQRIAERVHRRLCKSCRHAARQLERIDRGLRELRSDGPTTHPEWDASRAARLDASLRREIERD